MVACAILLLPCVSAAQTDLQAASVSWVGAESMTANTLVIGHTQSETWKLDADWIEVDEATTPMHVVVPGVAWMDTEPEHRYSTYTGVSLAGIQPQRGSFLYAVPGQARLHVDCAAQVHADEEAQFQVPDQVQRPNPNPKIPTTTALRGQSCGAVQLCGSFTMALWSWTAAGTHRSGELTISTGRSEAAVEAGPAAATQAYVAVQDGCLTLPSGSSFRATEIRLFNARLHLVHPVGLLNGEQTGRDSLDLEGRFEAHLQRHTGAPAARVAITQGTATIHDQAAPLDTETRDASPPWKLMSAMATVVLSLLGGALRGFFLLRDKLGLAGLADESGRTRPHKAKVPKKTVRFWGEEDKLLSHAVEIEAAIAGQFVNDTLLDLIRRGLRERQRERAAQRADESSSPT